MERKTFRLKLNDLDDHGVFTGYAGIFAIEDLQNDIIERGAFKRTLDHSNGSVPILWQHKPEEPIGVGLEAKEDSNGLYVRGQLNLDTQRGKEAYSLLKQGAIKGLSIGYDPVKKEYKDGKRILKEIKLYEYSVVTFPAQPLANILDIKEVPEEGKPEGGRGWDETENSWRYRIRNPNLFIDGSFRSKEITDGVTLVMGKLKDGDDSMTAQSVVFNKDKFPEKVNAQKWLDEHEDLTKKKSMDFNENFDEMQRQQELYTKFYNLNDALNQATLEIFYPNEYGSSELSIDEKLYNIKKNLDNYVSAYYQWASDFLSANLKSIKPIDFKSGRVLSSVNLSQIKDVIATLQALVEKAEPPEDPVDDHSDEEKQPDDPADTKSDSETSLDDELQTLLHDMKSYITR